MEYIFKIPGVKFFLSERISQDPLENFFGCQRQRGRTGENPNVQQFCKNTQALRVMNSVCGNVPKGNCRGRKQSDDIQENKALPKRRRNRKQTLKNGQKWSTNEENESALKDEETINEENESVLNNEETISEENESALEDEETINEENESALEDEETISEENKNALKDEETIGSLPVMTSDSSALDLTSDLAPTTNFNSVSPPAINLTSVLLPTMNLSSVSPPAVKQDHVSPPAKLVCREQLLKPDLTSRKFAHNLMPLQEEMIKKALVPGTVDAVIVKGYGIALRCQDMWTLNSCRWLNDQVSKPFVHVKN